MKISEDVMVVLSDMETDGPRARIVEQLDRKLYTRTNDVLVALGGKWDRKVKAHVFPTSAAERIDTAIVAGEVTTAREVGFFETPELLAAQLVKLADVKPTMTALEPSAGRGRIVQALQDAGAIVTALEADADRRDWLLSDVLKSRDKLIGYHDFLDYRLPSPLDKFDRVVMNPPFCKSGRGDHIDHVRHAYAMLKPGGVLVSVLPAGVSFRKDSRYRQFREWLLDSGTIEPLPAGSFSASGTEVNTVVARIVR